MAQSRYFSKVGNISERIIQDNTYNDQGQIVQMTRGNHHADMTYELFI